ncbi:MAG TPA: hypothetical protein VF122_04495 [Caulobacteraceae bacterium]
MVIRQDTVVMYRDLANRWEDRARSSRNDSGRERCEQLADAYRSLVVALTAELKLQARVGA